MLSIWSKPNFYHFMESQKHRTITSLPINNLKAFTDDNFKEPKIVQFFFDRVENIVGKGENVDFLHILISKNVFKRLLSKGH